MSYVINNAVTAYLPLNTQVSITAVVGFAGWHEQVALSDPNNLTNEGGIGQGTQVITLPRPVINTPASYGTFQQYPVNVIINSDHGSNQATWYPSYVKIVESPNCITVFSQDQNPAHNWNNLIVVFTW